MTQAAMPATPSVEQTPVRFARARAYLRRFPDRPTWWIVFLIIAAAGAFFRFWRLDYQAYWTDDSHTIYRILGSFDRMLKTLDNQGFPPGWYATLRAWANFQEWRLGSGAAAFSEGSLRILPTFLGTMTVPACYFLGRQFMDKRGALLVMLLAAVNPFLIYYSRDIKMYSAMWLFATLNMSLFFQWQTTHRHWLWFPLWTLAGCAMVAMHSLTWFIVGLQLVFLLTRPRPRAFDAPPFVAGVLAMSLLPIWWFLHKSNWITRLVEDNTASGLGWVPDYTDMNWRTIASLPSSHVLGFLWPARPDAPDADWERVFSWFHLGSNFKDHLDTRFWPGMATAQFWAIVALFAVMVIGLFPWRGGRGRTPSPERERSCTRGRWWWVALWILVPTLSLALTWLTPGSAWYRAIFGDRPITVIWEPRYLGIILPAFLLWVAAALRRLPFWPLRWTIGIALIAVCTISSLSNHLMYRHAPLQRVAATIARYYQPSDRNSIAFCTPSVKYLRWQDFFSVQIACGIRPTSPSEADGEFIEPMYFFYNFRHMYDSSYVYNDFIDQASRNSRIKTIVLVDRHGDVADEVVRPNGRKVPNPLASAAIQDRLGPGWKLDLEEKYEWHYEWRYYIFHTWRTRVWVRVPPKPATASAPATRRAARAAGPAAAAGSASPASNPAP